MELDCIGVNCPGDGKAVTFEAVHCEVSDKATFFMCMTECKHDCQCHMAVVMGPAWKFHGTVERGEA